MPILLKLLGLLKGVGGPVATWWKSLSWNARIILVVVVAVVGTVWFQHSVIRHNEEVIEQLKAQMADLATKAEVAKLDGKISSTADQIKQTDTNLSKLETDLNRYKGGIKPPVVTGMPANDIVNAFKAIGN